MGARATGTILIYGVQLLAYLKQNATSAITAYISVGPEIEGEQKIDFYVPLHLYFYGQLTSTNERK
jgi:hypothetical protein